MAGGLPVNLPYEGALKNSEYGENVSKLFKRKKGITPEQHYKLNEFIRVLVASTEGGLLQFGSKHGGGNKEAEKVAIYANNLRHMFQCKKLVKDIVFNRP
jgi:aromatic ring hydroxylase